MMNFIWLGLVLAAVIISGFTGRMKELTDGTFDSAKTAVTIAIGLIGVMALWLGIMRLAEKSGLVQIIARALRPLTQKLFPDVPPDHPAMGSIVMTIAANMLGLSNAATPLGLRAMGYLDALNPTPGTATNAMCTFLAISTSSVQLIPATAVAILASAGSHDPTAIIGTSLIATTCAAAAGIISVKWLEKLPVFRLPAAPATTSRSVNVETNAEATAEPEVPQLNGWRLALLFSFIACFAMWFVFDVFFPGAFGRPTPKVFVTQLHIAQSIGVVPITPIPVAISRAIFAAQQPLFSRAIRMISLMAIPFFVSFFPLYASLRRVKVYEEFVEGAKEGFNVAVRIIPYLVAILVAVGMFRAAGGIEMLSKALTPFFDRIGFPTDLLPMVIVRPLSGSATTGLFTEIVKNLGPDNLVTRMAGTIFGSTETTFYVIAVYFGSVAVRRTRHAILAGLTADLTGVIASVIVCRIMFG